MADIEGLNEFINELNNIDESYYFSHNVLHQI